VRGLVGQYTAEFVTGVRDVNDEGDWSGYLRELDRAGVDRYVNFWDDALKDAGY